MDLNQLPENLPEPVDDGAANHLQGMALPAMSLIATNNKSVDIHKLPGLVVFYVYPMTGRPDTQLPDGWASIPGARGCTPQSCAFRDHHGELAAFDTQVFGVSTQTTAYQQEAKERLHLPFDLLSDTTHQLKASIQLPTFEVAGMELYKRITLIARDGKICKVFYPVFPPDENAEAVLNWVKANP
ncbi:MAG: peroxiredoxin [Cyanobacteria bacterium P01_C01_bin.89]